MGVGGGGGRFESRAQPAIGGQQCYVTLHTLLQNKSVVCSGSRFTKPTCLHMYFFKRQGATGTLFLLNTLCDVSRLYERSLPHAQTCTSVSQTVMYWSYRDVLTCLSDSLLKVDKLIVPKMHQLQMLDKIHETHLGIVRCKSRARRVLLWPGMSAQREDCCSLPGV